jgi:predicted acylesterase/phospholipase RssA
MSTFRGISNARFYGEKDATLMAAEGVRSVEREQAHLRRTGHSGALPTANYLALSGGGDDGAFGAGLLVGWTAKGTRPKFKLVTGISTGALGAPFAFLGSESDAALTEVYTQITQADVFTQRMMIAAVTDEALADSTPLYLTFTLPGQEIPR